MTRNIVRNEYFSWLCDLVCGDRFASTISYDMLLNHLHATEFRYLHTRDRNRAEDGKSLRYRFVLEYGYPNRILEYLDGPCSVLELMVAIALHIEEKIMDDPLVGNRTKQWFWGMATSLGLGSSYNDRYDASYVDMVLNRFLDRQYEPNGKGGLFTVKRHEDDMREIEIFRQMCAYVNSITYS